MRGKTRQELIDLIFELKILRDCYKSEIEELKSILTAKDKIIKAYQKEFKKD